MFRGLAAGLILIVGWASIAAAQSGLDLSPPSHRLPHRFEVIPLGGYSWTSAMDVTFEDQAGTLDFEDAGYWGAALDVSVSGQEETTGQVRFLYRRSDSRLHLRLQDGRRFDADAALELYQVGGLAGYERGRALPFASVTVGGSRLIGTEGDAWKFAMIVGGGVKFYATPRIGLLLHANVPIVFTDTWGALAIGGSGAHIAISGTGVTQFDVGGGLAVCF